MALRSTLYVPRFGLFAALAVAFLLGLVHLGSEQLWFDEVLSRSIYVHSENLSEMTTYLANNENHPPLYYWLMRGWTLLFGSSPFAIRFPSVLFTVLAVGLLYGLARTWFDRRTATVAALLYALLPFAVEFSREARPYALLVVFAVGSFWLLVSDSGVRSSWWRFSGFVVVTLAGLYTHYAYWFVFGSQLVAAGLLLMRRARGLLPPERQRRRMFGAAVVFILLGYAPWLPVLATNLYQQYLYVEGLDPISAIVAPSNFLFLDAVFNFLFLPAKWPVDSLGRLLQTLFFFTLAIGAVQATVLAWRAVYSRSDSTPQDSVAAVRWERLLVVWMWLVVPIGLFLLSPISGRYSWYYPRHLITVLPALCLMAAIGLQIVSTRAGKVFPRLPMTVVGLVVLTLFNLPQYVGNDSAWDPQHQFANATGYIEQQDRGGQELIIGFWPNYRLLLDYYYRGRQTVGSLVPERLYSNQLEIVTGGLRLNAMEAYLLTHPNIPYRDYLLPDGIAAYDRIWVVSVTPNLFDLDVALARAGFYPTFVELPRPVRLSLFRFERTLLLDEKMKK